MFRMAQTVLAPKTNGKDRLKKQVLKTLVGWYGITEAKAEELFDNRFLVPDTVGQNNHKPCRVRVFSTYDSPWLVRIMIEPIAKGEEDLYA